MFAYSMEHKALNDSTARTARTVWPIYSISHHEDGPSPSLESHIADMLAQKMLLVDFNSTDVTCERKAHVEHATLG